MLQYSGQEALKAAYRLYSIFPRCLLPFAAIGRYQTKSAYEKLLVPTALHAFFNFEASVPVRIDDASITANVTG